MLVCLSSSPGRPPVSITLARVTSLDHTFILPLSEAQHATEHPSRVQTHTHVQIHLCSFSHRPEEHNHAQQLTHNQCIKIYIRSAFKQTCVKLSGISPILKISILCSSRLHLLDQRYSTNSNNYFFLIIINVENYFCGNRDTFYFSGFTDE